MCAVKVPMAKRVSPLIKLMYVTFFTAHQVVHSQPGVLYVTADNGLPCPHGIPITQCNTLDWYSHNIDISFTSNTEMVFLSGTHSLETFIEVTNCHNFTMTGNGSASHTSDGLPQPTSWINCHGAFRSGLFFINSSEIYVTNLGLDSCSGKATFERHFTVSIALAFDRVSNIILYQVLINNTKGFGLHCDNIFGDIQVMESVFINARGDSRSHVYGGNARFWFGSPCLDFKSNLVIDTTWFLYGEETAHDHYYNASGLQVLIFCRGVHVMINNITADENRGYNGGNLALSLTDFGSDVSTITINNSRILNGRALKGGGIRFWSQIESNTENIHNTQVSILNIINSNFYNNVANLTGGAVYIAHYEVENYYPSLNRKRQIIITNCKFVQNNGNGAAMEILKQTFPGYITHFTPQFSVRFDMCKFSSNRVPLNKHSSIMELIGTKSVHLSNCNFTNNYGSVFSLRNSNLNFHDSIHFVNNSAAYGAALKFCDSSLVFLHSGTNVLFFNNTAQRGGAIYAQQGCLDTYPACFFQPAVNRTIPIEEFGEHMTVKFANNSAKLAGDAIYGGSIDYCYTVVTFSFNGTDTVFNNLYIFRAIFDMAEQHGPSNISSNPRGVCFCNLAYRVKICKKVSVSQTIFPGQKFNISVTTIGQLNGTTYGLIDATLVNGHPTDELISSSNLRAHNGCTNLTYKVLSMGTNVIVNFTAVTSDVNTYYNPTNASLCLSLLPCPLGFKLTKKQCDCDPLLQSKDILSPVKCDIDKQVIHVHTNNQLWFGCNKHNNDNQSHCYLAVNLYCSHYCTSHDYRINVSNRTSFDDQCLPGRTGILCGACKPGLSSILGSPTKCKPCSSWNLLFLIPIFLLSGLFIVILLSILNLTVTEGTLNGLIIYANTVYTHQDFFPSGTYIIGKICWIFIAWINFDVGLELCFYKGMDGYKQTWFLYGFIFYLISVQVIIIVLCRRFLLFTRLFGRNIVKVLATLLFLMCSPLTYAILQTLQCTHLHISTPNGTKKRLVWYYDGNVPCLGAKHLPLFVVGITCAVAVCWFTFSLLLVQCLQRRANLFCFRWVEKFRPLFEAYTGPCRDNYRFWPGFLMFMRLGLYVLNTVAPTFTNTPIQRKLASFGTAAVCVIILSLSCIFPHGVYKKWPLNMLEFSFFLNLCITSALWTISESNAIVYTSVDIAMTTFLGILIYHIGAKMKINICDCMKFKIWLLKFAQKIPFKHQIGLYCCPKDTEDNDETTTLLSQPLPPVIQCGQYREPLIGDTHNLDMQ